MIIYNLTLELSKQSEMPCIYAKQGDSQSRHVVVTLTDNGTVYLPSDGEAHFRARKPDGTTIYDPARINADGTVTLTLTEQTLAVSGTVLADVCLCSDSGKVLSCAPFKILVDGMPQGDPAQSSNEWLSLLNRLYTLELGSTTEEQLENVVSTYLEKNPAVFTPSISVDGWLSWSNNRGLANPERVNIVQLVVDALGGAPVFGVVDKNNIITVSSVLPDGSYLLCYEDADGNVTEIGTVIVGEEESVTVVNLFDAAQASLNARWSNSSYTYVTANGYVVSDYIAVSIPENAENPSMLHWRGGELVNNANIMYFDSGKAILQAADASSAGAGSTPSTVTVLADENGDYQTALGFKNGELQSNWQESTAYIRICLQVNSTSTALTQEDISGIIITVDQLID